MISSEPIISVGLIENAKEVRGNFNGYFELPSSIKLQGSFWVTNKEGRVVLYDDEDVEVIRSEELYCRSLNGATFTLERCYYRYQFSLGTEKKSKPLKAI